MGRGGQGTRDTAGKERKAYSWSEVQTHTDSNDRWLVIEGQVYNISTWARRHPGGSRVIGHYAGQDATDAFRAFHNDLDAVKKYLKPIHIGSVVGEEQQASSIDSDFRNLRETADKMGLFSPSYFFFFVHLAHILAFEAAGYLVMRQFGTGWIPWLISLLCTTTVQAQTGWLQHDFGHLSVFKNKSNLDHILHYFTMGFIKGASPHWWNHMHFQHHAKPNVMDKDPDVRVEKLFVIGKQMPVKIAQTQKSSMPYNWQQHYWFVIGPPLLFPVYFQFMLFRHIYTRKLWTDLLMVTLYFVRLFVLYFPLLGWGIIPYYFMLSLHVLGEPSVSLCMNHVPMDFLSCSLFPTMPRHNLYKIAPMVKSLCQKHGIDYQVKSLYRAFADIVKTLKHSGELWYSTYQQFHSS
ncbi:acyl-CoA 6-desaturase-like [Babylonia areolata]|uniref:acyl-CoA 6-desaturase-like n=1 Tax=Babylonia areolata TaxID=304850 RepID=UPI003FD05D9C